MKSSLDKIRSIIESAYPSEEDFHSDLDDRILDYVDDYWDRDGDYHTEYEWYQDFGGGEAEDEIINEILHKIKEGIGRDNMYWYFSNEFGDIDEMIFKQYPEL